MVNVEAPRGCRRHADLARTGSTTHRPWAFLPALLTNIWKPLPRVVSAVAACAVLVGLSAELLDRPVATWVHQHLGDARFDWFTANYEGHVLVIGPFSLMASPAQALGPLAVLVIAISAVAAAGGRRPRMRGRIILALAVSVFAAKEIYGLAKWVFGQTWPETWLGDNPSWIRDGVYGFFPFHGGPGWGSFPSGHMTVITSLAMILRIVWPELRAAWAAILAVVIIGLIGANYHFVSDIVGGLFLGAATGRGVAGLLLSPRDRLDWSILRKSAPPDERPVRLRETEK
jgi:membrane-associated phospholipid phosphatase